MHSYACIMEFMKSDSCNLFEIHYIQVNSHVLEMDNKYHYPLFDVYDILDT